MLLVSGGAGAVEIVKNNVGVNVGVFNTDAVNVGQLKAAIKLQASEIYELKRQLQALAHQT